MATEPKPMRGRTQVLLAFYMLSLAVGNRPMSKTKKLQYIIITKILIRLRSEIPYLVSSFTNYSIYSGQKMARTWSSDRYHPTRLDSGFYLFLFRLSH